MKRHISYITIVLLAALLASCQIGKDDHACTQTGKDMYDGWTDGISIIVNTDLDVALFMNEWINATASQRSELEHSFFSDDRVMIKPASNRAWTIEWEGDTIFSIVLLQGNSLDDIGGCMEINPVWDCTTNAPSNFLNVGSFRITRESERTWHITAMGPPYLTNLDLTLVSETDSLPFNLDNQTLTMTGRGLFQYSYGIYAFPVASSNIHLAFQIEEPVTFICRTRQLHTLRINSPEIYFWEMLSRLYFNAGKISLRAYDNQNAENSAIAHILNYEQVEIGFNGISQIWPVEAPTETK